MFNRFSTVLFALVCLLAPAFFFSGCNSGLTSPDSVKICELPPFPQESLRLASGANIRPFCFRVKNLWNGMDFSIAQILGQTVQKPVTLQPMRQSDLIQALDSGLADVVLSGIPCTDANREKVDFTEPIGGFAYLPLLRRDRVRDFLTVDSICATSDSIVVLKDSRMHAWVREHAPNATVIPVETPVMALNEVLTRKAPLFLTHGLDVLTYADIFRKETTALMLPLEADPLAWAVKKGNKPLLDYLNAVIFNLKGRGVLAEYLQAGLPSLTPPGNTP